MIFQPWSLEATRTLCDRLGRTLPPRSWSGECAVHRMPVSTMSWVAVWSPSAKIDTSLPIPVAELNLHHCDSN